MAEKKKTAASEQPKATKTVAITAAKNIARGIFANSQATKVVHITSDGTAFYTRNDAQNYARSLRKSEVITVKREDCEEQEAPAEVKND